MDLAGPLWFYCIDGVSIGLPNNLVRRGAMVPFHTLLERVFNQGI